MIEHADDIRPLGQHFVERIGVNRLHEPAQVTALGVEDGCVARDHRLLLAVPHVSVLNRRVRDRRSPLNFICHAVT